MSSKIFIVEDHPIFRDGLVNYINKGPDLEVCGEADNVASALDSLEEKSPDLVVLDLQLKHSSGFDLIQDIRYRWPQLRILILSMYDETLYADRVLQAGASGYVMKDQGPDTVLTAIRSILRGVPYASEHVKEQVLRKGMRRAPIDALTDRELQVFQLLGEGKSVTTIAEMLNRSQKTIQNHTDNIRNKLIIKSRQELYQSAKEWVMRSGSP